MNFSNDVDLLHWEPNVFRDAAWASQTLLSGGGDLDGTGFTIDSGSLADARVATKHVIVLGGSVAGSFPIVSVEDATHLTLSILYDELFPTDAPAQPTPIATAADLTFAIRTFSPQAKVVSDLLRSAAGCVAGSDAIQILNPQSLRRTCSLGTLQMIYSALAAAATEPGSLLARADLYERLYRRSLRSVRVQVDTDGDGIIDAERPLNVIELQRA